MNVAVSEVEAEVRAVVMARIDQKQDTSKSWIKQMVLDGHLGIEGPDRDWHLTLSSEGLDDVVRRVLSRFKAKPDVDEQLLLPGFRRLQQCYLIERDGDPTAVYIGNMSKADFHEKAREYRRMADGCNEHAEELERYAMRAA